MGSAFILKIKIFAQKVDHKEESKQNSFKSYVLSTHTAKFDPRHPMPS